jgi:CubicO group peptidase (beta-lactamase class C family)
VNSTPALHDRLAELAARTALDAHCPTVTWGLLQDGVLAASASVGSLPDGTSPDADTVYRIASMTKSFTAAAVLSLRDEGALALDDPIARHAPELAGVVGHEGSPPVTLRHLLSMTSGLATDDAWADRHLDMSPDELDDLAREPLFAHVTNEAFEYSNLGFAFIGRVVWRATGVRLQDHVTTRLLGPLELHDTTWDQPAHDRWAHPRRVVEGEVFEEPTPPLGDGEMAPMGGLWSTVRDLARWVSWLDAANSRPHEAHTVGLSAASRREMQRMHTYVGVTTLADRTGPAGYGFGLNIRDDADLGMVVAHSGGVPGYGSNMRWLKGRGLGVIALANNTYAPMSDLTMRMLLAVHEHGAVPAAVPVTSALVDAAAHRLVDLLTAWSDDAADALFADNVGLDESYERRAAAAAQLVEEHGRLQVLSVQAERRTAGTVTVQGDAGREPFDVEFDLAPLADAKVQYYGLTS